MVSQPASRALFTMLKLAAWDTSRCRQAAATLWLMLGGLKGWAAQDRCSFSGVQALLQTLQDDSQAVREAASRALLEGSRYQSCARGAVECQLLDEGTIPFVLPGGARCGRCVAPVPVLALCLLGNPGSPVLTQYCCCVPATRS
jgi:hypothetical protein